MNYFEKLTDLMAGLEPGTVNHVMVRHDDWCGHFRGKPCNCNPDVSLEVPGWMEKGPRENKSLNFVQTVSEEQ